MSGPIVALIVVMGFPALGAVIARYRARKHKVDLSSQAVVIRAQQWLGTFLAVLGIISLVLSVLVLFFGFNQFDMPSIVLGVIGLLVSTVVFAGVVHGRTWSVVLDGDQILLTRHLGRQHLVIHAGDIGRWYETTGGDGYGGWLVRDLEDKKFFAVGKNADNAQYLEQWLSTYVPEKKTPGIYLAT